MIDLQVAFPQDIIQLTQVQELFGYSPRAVLVEGRDFRHVEEVRINDEISPRFTIVAKTRLIAQVPTSELNKVISEVSVLASRLTMTPESILRFKIKVGEGDHKVHGFLRLLQVYVKIFLQTPGSDIWSPGLGGGLLSKVGSNVSRVDGGKGLIAEAVICNDNTARQIISLQAKQPLPPEERLLSAKIVASSYDPSLQMLTISPKVISHAGVTGYATLAL